jgi:hypothetical protein
VGHFENTGFATLTSSGKGAFDIAEQFTLQDRLWQGSTIYRHKGFTSTPAGIVNGMGKDLFAGTGPPVNEDGRIYGGIFPGQPYGSLQRLALTEDIFKPKAG